MFFNDFGLCPIHKDYTFSYIKKYWKITIRFNLAYSVILRVWLFIPLIWVCVV
jgi:hypothetical protein